MARGKRLTIGSRAVAVAVLQDVIAAAAEHVDFETSDNPARELADALVSAAWDVEYKPTVERLVITISAGIEAPDKMRSTPEDQQ